MTPTGTRSRPAGAAIAALMALLMALALGGCSSVSPGSLPSLAPTTPYPSVLQPAPTAAPVPTPAPSATARPYRLGGSGSVVLAQTAQAALGNGFVVAVTAVDPQTGSARQVSRGFTLPDGWVRYPDGGVMAAPDGRRIALEVAGEDEVTGGTVIVDLADETTDGAELAVLDGSTPTWLPDGSLVLFGGGTEADPGHLDHIPPGADAPDVTLTETDGRSFNRVVGAFVMASDGSGVFGSVPGTGDDNELVVFSWDGSVTPREPGTAPLFNTGTERPAAADGSTIGGGCDAAPSGATCATQWQRPDGRSSLIRTTTTDISLWPAWTRDGTAAVLLDTSLWTARDTGRTTIGARLLARLPATGMGYRLLGLSDTAVVVADEGLGLVYLVDLEQGGISQVLQGTFAGVLR